MLPRVMTLLVLVAGAESSRAAAQDLPTPRHLELELRVDYETGQLEGVAAWTLHNAGATPVDSVPVQVGRLMRVIGARVGPEGSSAPLTQDVVQYHDWPRMQVTQAWIRLPAPLAPGAETTLEIDYEGVLVPYAETGMRYVRDHVAESFTILRSESYAFPQIALPSVAALREQPATEFTYGLEVRVPDSLTVATGVPGESRSTGTGLATWRFVQKQPVPFLNVAIAPYEVLADGGLRVFHFPEDAQGARTLLAALTDARTLFAEWFGERSLEAGLHVIEIPEGWGSQASATGGIIQTADAFRDPESLSQLYHELAHLWHPADLDRPASRWNEGLATFLANRVAAVRDDPGSLATRMSALAKAHVARLSAEQLAVPLAEYGSRRSTDLSYGTGAILFYALYAVLGEEAFDGALAAWFDEYRSQGSTSAQFVEVIRRRAPQALPVLQSWLFSTEGLRELAAGKSLESVVRAHPR